jgi:O-antigen ligase/tetratricopeptide (TPR) repeat protein
MIPPFIFGGRQAYGQLALAVLVLTAFGFWVIGKVIGGRIVISLGRAELLIPVVAIGLSIFSWIYLPSGLVERLSPGIQRLLPGWRNGDYGDGSGWHTFSLTPGLSRDATLLFILYALLFWITLDTVRHRDSVYRLLRILFACGVGVSSVGLLHYLFWNGKFYWLWDVWWVEPENHVRAPFTNRNHFAGFLALTLGPGVAVLARIIRGNKTSNYCINGNSASRNRIRDFKILVTAGGLTLILAGIGLSQSRGGTIVGLTVVVASLAGLCRNGLNRKTGLAAATVILIGSLILAATFGSQVPFQRTTRMLAGNESLASISNARLQLWAADLHALLDFPLFGSGPGSHQYVHTLYLEKPNGFTYTHAENCYVQILVECGLAGVGLLLLAIAFLIHWTWKGLRPSGRETGRSATELSLAVSVSLLAALVHAVVDFVWYVPAYAATLAVLAGLCRSLARRKELQAIREPRFSTTHALTFQLRSRILRLGLGLASIGLGMTIAERFVQAVPAEYAWNNFYRLLPSDWNENRQKKTGSLDERLSWLTEACKRDSVEPEHYYRLGLANLEKFLQHQKACANPAGLLETQRIFRESNFETSSEAQAWLQDRYGDDLALLENARAALAKSLDCCPLMASSYLHLAKLDFLDISPQTDLETYWQEAQLTGPYNSDVHMQVGLGEWLAGDRLKARDSWIRACELNHECQSRLLPLLSARLPAEDLVEYFPFDFEGLKWLALRETELGRLEDSEVAVIKAQQAVEGDSTQAKNPALWVELYGLYQQVEMLPQAEACIRKAVHLAPDRLGLHLLLIRSLMENAQWKAALEQAQDTRSQFFNQPDVQALVKDILAMKPPKASRVKNHRDPKGKP